MLANSRRRSFTRQSLSFEHCEVRRLLAGDVAFADPVRYDAGDEPANVSIADVDDDGTVDLVVGDFAGRLTVLLGEGDGTFGQALGAARFPGWAHTVGDFDGDGKADIGAAVLRAGTFNVLLNLGSTDDQFDGFSEAHPFGPDDFKGWGTASSGDLDGDGDLDALVRWNDEALWVLLNNGSSDGQWDGFADPEIYYGTSCCVQTEDVDQDGNLDVITGRGETVVMLGHGDGTFDNPARNVGGGSILADLNGDGDLDAAGAFHGSNSVSVSLGNGDGTFEQLELYSVRGNVWDMTSGDFDGDGDMDLAWVDRNQVWLFINRGDGTFFEQEEWFSYESGLAESLTTELTAWDVDDDGDTDLAVAASYDSGRGVHLFLNTANFNVAGHGTIGDQTLSDNLARNGDASQSSTARNQPRFAASNATDGDPRSGSWTANGDAEPSWQVELPRTEAIGRIVVDSRRSFDGGGLRIQVLDEEGTEVWGQDHRATDDERLEIELPKDQRIEGRNIRLTKIAPIESSLQLNEVEVYAAELELGPQRVVTFDLNALDQNSDRLRFHGTLHIAGSTLQVNLVDGTPAEGMQFQLIDTVATTGKFDHLVLPELPQGLVWNASELYSEGVLRIDAAELAGDFDGDGQVGFADFLILSSTFNQVGTDLQADANNDEVVDFNDFLILSDNFGARQS